MHQVIVVALGLALATVALTVLPQYGAFITLIGAVGAFISAFAIGEVYLRISWPTQKGQRKTRKKS